MRTSSQLRSPSNHSNSNGNHSNRLNDSSGELCRLTNDMESLRCVLKLKQADIPTLSKQNAELQRENDEQRSLSNRVTLLHRLYRSVNRFVLNYDQLCMLICQIAAILNNRSLLSVSENPDDLDALTSAHLLFGGPPTRVTQLQQVFWTRWREEYLTLLQQRSKWRTPDRRLQVNDVVLVKDENLPPLRWPLARVMSLIPGKDGECRVAELKTTCGSTRRAINKLCLLPLKDDVER
ncbi:uncharacterized protein LOC132797773 [Drosophila nasuta]|uniref:uncharacterized protein LOC132797773 n=1 Tax=Drosophila nasuta TaxID=42062 RepID=UPI00295E3A86|nr:uncharacterized protein LOC132797773 [Drosophila nasuta]